MTSDKGTTPAMYFGLRKYPFHPGATAEVTGITGKGRHNQRGLMVVTYPDGTTKTATLTNLHNVKRGIRFAAKFYAQCGQMGSV